jgi:hypothetical protein
MARCQVFRRCPNDEKVLPMPVSSDGLEQHVRVLCEEFSPRDAFHPEQLDRAAAYIRNAFEATGGQTFEQSYSVEQTEYRNVIVRFGSETSERIVVGAHYDAIEGAVGADDNASGVAGLIELAHLIDGASLSSTVELVAYTLEEPPFFYTRQMGSAVHARSLKASSVSVRAMLALEMIGYFSDRPKSQGYPMFFLKPFYPERGNFIVVIGKWGQGRLVRRVETIMQNATSLPVESFVGPRIVPGVNLSDHLNYWSAGYEAAMITDTAFYRNPNYHTRQDVPETLDYERMSHVVEGVYAAVQAISEQA